MRISFDAYFDKEEDGYSGSVSMTRDDIDDLYGLLNLFHECANALGYSYVKSVGFEKDDETIVWSDF